jgi:hypothetical protein
MRKSANARFAIKNWDEKPYSEGQGEPRLTRASVTKTYTGDIEGEAEVEYLMMYRSDGSATFVGLERVVGRIGEKTGTFVLQRIGSFESGQAKRVLFRDPRVCNWGPAGTPRRWQLRRWARHGAPFHVDL